MSNTSDEINIIDAEIKKVEKAIREEVANYNEAKRACVDSFQRCGEQARDILANGARDASEQMKTSKQTIKNLQSRLDTLKQSRENKLNKIVFREDLEEVDKLQKEAEELKQKKAELSAKYDKPQNHTSTPQDTASTQQKERAPLSVPSGTQWPEVKISFIDNENVSIKIGDVSQGKNYAEMGFKDLRTCKPVKSWNTLLYFSEKECLKYTQNSKSKTEKAVEDLRRRLKLYFCIQSDPIVLAHGYKPVFKVCKSEGESRSVHAFSNSDAFDDNTEGD